MDSKLTLNIDKELADKAKVYARNNGRSLSDLVENYFKFLTSISGDAEPELTTRVKSLLGSITVPEEVDNE
jgi:uncharacterized protein DUF6364